jgi:hypothetical protein
MSTLTPTANAAADPVAPDELPFLESLSWFDTRWRELSALEMLQRYERGWRNRGVTGDPSAEELAFLRALILRFGSVLDVPA